MVQSLDTSTGLVHYEWFASSQSAYTGNPQDDAPSLHQRGSLSNAVSCMPRSVPLVLLYLENGSWSRAEVMTIKLYPLEQAKHRRRAHQKSRRGCGNCKLRRVKCDETYPRCQRCTSFSVSCDYESVSNKLELAMNGAGVFHTPQKLPVSFNQLILSMVNTPHKMRLPEPEQGFAHDLRLEDLEILSRFQSRTVLTIGTKESAHVYQREWFKVACEHPMFMHVVLAMTLMHDRHLTGFKSIPQYSEAYHHYQGIVMFKRKLTDHQTHEKDALWASAALLGAMSFAQVDANTRDEAWPLKAPSESDLSWLRMTDGKQVVWKLADPMREGSIIKEALQQVPTPRPEEAYGLANCPSFLELDRLGEYTAGGDNPCRDAASILTPLLAMECNHSTIVKFLSFTSHTTPEYRLLLVKKDPVALLLLAYWYAKLCPYKQWWVQPRAVLECQAICVYLDKYHGNEEGLQDLLQFPKIMSGLVFN